MKRSLLMFFLILLSAAKVTYAGISVCYNPDNTVSNASLRGDQIPGCDYYDAGQNATQAKYDQVRTLLKTVEKRYLKKLNGDPVEMSPSEKTAVDDALAAQLTAQVRTNAKANLVGFQSVPLYQRAYADVDKDETNILRAWLMDLKADIAASVSLADLKARIALNPDLPDRTLAQLKTAINNRVDSGSVDS